MRKIVILLSIILFIIPFFWLKPGEMDLGGDASRLYFYNPIAYLFNQSLYAIVSSGIGGEAVSYWAIPHLLFLVFLKSILRSPTFLISLFNGISLSVAFFSIYCIVIELTKEEDSFLKERVQVSGILAGLFYIFSPYLILGWDRALLTHSQIFLNPLMFFLLLRYFVTYNLKYLLGALLTTFIFSPNFSYVAAPPFFAFYSLSLLFLFLYVKYIRKTPLPLKGLCVGAVIFLSLQAFHILPQLISLLSKGSIINEAVFSEKAKLSRGLDYFIAIASNIKVSLSFMNLPQLTKLSPSAFVFIVFPAIMLFGILWSKRKTILLTAMIFLVTLFLATANITNIGFIFYKALFYIPGFSMFRNFYGQWGFVFVFFYTILIGQSISVVVNKVNRKLGYFLIVLIATLLISNAWSFINGSLYRIDLHQTKHVKPIIQMDPKYEEVLTYMRNLPIDGKVLSFPFPDPGYQLITGENGGVYVGPSTFSYLVGKNDFTGYEGLLPFSEFFLQAVGRKDFQSISNLFSILNIRYIFYNSDPYIFDNTFPGFPYGYVRDFLPETQALYKEFVDKLPLAEKIDFGDKFHLYTVDSGIYLPHIYATNNLIQTNEPLTYLSLPQFKTTLPFAVFHIDDTVENPNAVFLEAKNNNPLFDLKNNFHLHKHRPFISLRFDDVRYPLALLREEYNRFRLRNKHDRYMDLSFLHLTKRIFELDTFGEKLPILRNEWKQSGIWRFINFQNRYNSWEAVLDRYKSQAEQLIEWVESLQQTKSWKEANKIKINEQLFQHQINLETYIKTFITKEEDKRYLLALSQETFNILLNELNLEPNNPSLINANITGAQDGEYEVYLVQKSGQNVGLKNAFIEIQGKTLKPLKVNSNFVQFDNVVFGSKASLDFTARVEPVNLVKRSVWMNSGAATDSEDSSELEIRSISGNSLGDYAKETGLVKEITDWKPNTQYLVTFDYLTFSDDFIFKLYERKFVKGASVLPVRLFFEKNLNSNDWKTHQSVLTSDLRSISGYVHFLSNNEKLRSRMLIRNLKVEEVSNPKIIFKKVLVLKQHAIPKILFTKINPTKYKVKVSDAKDPYALVFSEAFNSNWKLYRKDGNSTDKIGGTIARMFRSIGRFTVGLFIKDQGRDDTIKQSYFNGNVNEGEHTNIFLEPATFETWGKVPIAKDRHFSANGYANAWIVTPSDLDGIEEYELIIEFESQRFFYLLLGISALTFISILIILLRLIIARK